MPKPDPAKRTVSYVRLGDGGLQPPHLQCWEKPVSSCAPGHRSPCSPVTLHFAGQGTRVYLSTLSFGFPFLSFIPGLHPLAVVYSLSRVRLFVTPCTAA